ncbi:FHA domain-containing protein [Rothia sp. ZJ1223]|uniref:FHA domain-containing protein FhaB/FipA n=1 Tax=Rothia sp. ZJ1223 TaxID=2811098 RepID=UPI0019568A03|nr:FHA domain-containing protein [Rothia sp. ZJ1223]MBM7052277.1 FHA domain-containing protein [Rothia sp. ZJ1223]
MASEITVTLLRFAFLALLWLFVFMVLAAARRDLGIGRNLRAARTPEVAPSASVAPASDPTPVAPPPARATQLTIIDGAQAGAVMRLGDSPITIGRADDIKVALQDDYASGHHARLFPQGSRWFLEDLGSTNGTFVGDTRLTRATAIDIGTDFRVGHTTMRLKA